MKEGRQNGLGWRREKSQGNWIILQAKLVRVSWREDGWSLDCVEQRTEKNQVLGKAASGRIVAILDSGAGGLDAGKLGS